MEAARFWVIEFLVSTIKHFKQKFCPGGKAYENISKSS